MEEEDLFHHLKRDQNDKNEPENEQIDDKENESQMEIENDNNNDNEKNEEEDNDDNDENDKDEADNDDNVDGDDDEAVPQEVIDLFRKAIEECETQKELEDKWKEIIEEQSKKYSKLKHKLSKFDKIFIDGFQIEVDGVYRLNISALKRSLRMKHFSTRCHYRIPFSKQASYGSNKPSFAFIKGGIHNKYDKKNKQFRATSMWGNKMKQRTEAERKDDLQKWLNY